MKQINVEINNIQNHFKIEIVSNEDIFKTQSQLDQLLTSYNLNYSIQNEIIEQMNVNQTKQNHNPFEILYHQRSRIQSMKSVYNSFENQEKKINKHPNFNLNGLNQFNDFTQKNFNPNQQNIMNGNNENNIPNVSQSFDFGELNKPKDNNVNKFIRFTNKYNFSN